MSSTWTSQIRLPAPALAGAREGRGDRTGRKRRPVDPDETGRIPSAPYDRDGVGPSVAKRPRTIDDVMGSLSLRSLDPPGNSYCSKRKGDDGGADFDRSSKAARYPGESPADDDGRKYHGGDESHPDRPLDPSGRKGGSPTNVTSELCGPTVQMPCPSCAGLDCPCRQPGAPEPSTPAGARGGSADEMVVDDSDHESSDGSVSEGSIRSAMYQLVFGRRNPPLSVNDGSCGRYDAVDSKIEDLIRRSRLKAAVKSRAKDDGDSGMDVEWDGADAVNDDDDDWNPGHG
ncbi:hypothetical protein ACHAWF_014283 [Thalassiosira exigua]